MAGCLFALRRQIRAKPQQTLCRNRRGRAVDWLPSIERIRVLLRVVAEPVGGQRHAVPIGDSGARGITIDVVIARGASRFEKEIRNGTPATNGIQVCAFDGVEKLELLGESADDPRGATGPRRER